MRMKTENGLKRLVKWMDFVSIPCHLAGKSAQRMCHGTRPIPNFVCLRLSWIRQSRADIRLCCPVPNSTMGHNLSTHRLLRGRQQISHEWFSLDICSNRELILCDVSLCCRHRLAHFRYHLDPAISRKHSTIELDFSVEHFVCNRWTYLAFIFTHFVESDCVTR